ncbi:hypothetical protein SH1V18_25610 [Vallitalea longa]|uniref:Carbamoyltransferase C-terminal domain-containing protein n=1 Tax=Vallitalea longa TaxID=2936439 RepID=A0A9W5YCD9_9FIRM|nr:carbamoyltransferase C-terminal domain-containing protein [Vallitalea longa]GKX30081.1 hypothetical protein SH1V18_25610 [Vallitalea longa]
MRDGYYLSAYLEIAKAKNVFTIACRHDNCVALWKKTDYEIELIRYWEFERLTGYKQNCFALYDVEQCKDIINDLLKKEGLTLEDIIEIWGVPELLSDDSYLSKYRYPEYTYHCMSHLSSSVFIDTDLFKKENIIGFNVDGGSDCIVDAYKKEDEIFETDKYPFVGSYSKAGSTDMSVYPAYSPGLLWAYVAGYYYMREGSLMALSSASDSRAYIDVDDILVNTAPILDKEFLPENRLLDLINEIDSYTQEDAGTKFNYFDDRFSEKENKISMVMKIVQNMSFRIMETNINYAIKEYSMIPEETYLAMSGGFALNCPCNTYLMNKFNFKGFIAPPCVSDCGMALGIGLYSFYNKTQGKFNFKLESAYYGEKDSLETFLESNNEFEQYIQSINEFEPRQAAKDLMEEPIVWFDGHTEIGPRALGGRSLLGDPRKQATKDALNIIKKRQWWRPVAPIVLMECVDEWFENAYESPYMLHTLKIKDEKIDEVIAVAHSNGTARLQTIAKDTKQIRLYQVMQEFYKITGVPMICNTSLNDKGEPIINRIDEAFNFALRKKIRIMYVNGHRIEIKNHSRYTQKQPLRRKLTLGKWKNEEEYLELYNKYNPFHISDKVIMPRMIWGLPLDRIMNQNDKRDAMRCAVETKMFINTVGTLRKGLMFVLYSMCTTAKERETKFLKVEEDLQMNQREKG